jgi:hypothetical protein
MTEASRSTVRSTAEVIPGPRVDQANMFGLNGAEEIQPSID